jgi:hypothetical protein
MNTLAIASELEQSLEVDQTYSETRPRLEFIDFTRGLVMALMAWDHVSGFWNSIHGGLEGMQPQRNPSLDRIHFMSRFVTHYCAPTPHSRNRDHGSALAQPPKLQGLRILLRRGQRLHLTSPGRG